MKKGLLLITLFMVVSMCFAQKQTGALTRMPHQQGHLEKSISDTILPGNLSGNWLDSINPVLIGCAGGGFVLGNNAYGDLCKGERFPVAQSFALEGGIFWFGDKTIVGSPDSIELVAWSMNGWGGSTLAGSHNQACPGTRNCSIKIPMDAVDTSATFANAHVAMFTTPVVVYYDYVLGFDMSGFIDDTIGMVSSSDGEGDSLERVWEKWSDGNWYTLQAAGYSDYKLDIDAMIFPVVDLTNAGLCDNYFVNGAKVTLFPNPVSDMLKVTLETEKAATAVHLMLLDANGRLTADYGNVDAQLLQQGFDMNVSAVAPGNYYLLINAGGHKQARKVIIAR